MLMWHFIYRWIYQDGYQPLWSNWWAGITASIALYFWKGKTWLRRHKEHQKKIDEIHKHLGLRK